MGEDEGRKKRDEGRRKDKSFPVRIYRFQMGMFFVDGIPFPLLGNG